ncbi:hypothetical protein [Brevibacterium sp.]|uniref:endonuclease domain-containing protein n=1 Tax=Brevibacterium sp. TaxID=1701 RepID=UPI0025BBCB09|nr:hypothetical protein [Brevibacterium sp.]
MHTDSGKADTQHPGSPAQDRVPVSRTPGTTSAGRRAAARSSPARRTPAAWSCPERPEKIPVLLTAASAEGRSAAGQAGEDRAAKGRHRLSSVVKARPARRPLAPGVFAHPSEVALMWVPEWADDTWTAVRNTAAAVQLKKPAMAVSHLTAAHLYGWPLPASASASASAQPLDLTPLKSFSLVPGHHVHRPAEAEVWWFYGVTVTSPRQTLRQISSLLIERQLVDVIDAICGPWRSTALSTPADIAARLPEWPRFPGRARLRSALSRARAGVGSPQETRLRLLLVDAGLPEPTVGHSVDVGFAVLHPDLAYPALKIAIEYEGAHHRLDADQWEHDIRREQAMRDRGWTYLRITAKTSDAEIPRLVTEAFASRDVTVEALPLS